MNQPAAAHSKQADVPNAEKCLEVMQQLCLLLLLEILNIGLLPRRNRRKRTLLTSSRPEDISVSRRLLVSVSSQPTSICLRVLPKPAIKQNRRRRIDQKRMHSSAILYRLRDRLRRYLDEPTSRRRRRVLRRHCHRRQQQL